MCSALHVELPCPRTCFCFSGHVLSGILTEANISGMRTKRRAVSPPHPRATCHPFKRVYERFFSTVLYYAQLNRETAITYAFLSQGYYRALNFED